MLWHKRGVRRVTSKLRGEVRGEERGEVRGEGTGRLPLDAPALTLHAAGKCGAALSLHAPGRGYAGAE